jgi:hypothetical protein|nr:hypothetical protein [Kofleriaceae bacterium]
MTAAVGADIEALCSKCGDVWHVVVAKVGESIVRVLCKECGGQHRYKNPKGVPAAKKQAVSMAERAAKPARDKPVERFEKPAVSADLAKPVRPYRANEHFGVGERVDHVQFGQGVVELSESGKITVFFATGRRVLVQAKGEAPKGGLERPKPFDHSRPPAGGKPVTES